MTKRQTYLDAIEVYVSTQTASLRSMDIDCPGEPWRLLVGGDIFIRQDAASKAAEKALRSLNAAFRLARITRKQHKADMAAAEARIQAARAL